MTAALEDLQHCPYWPRWLSQEQAAQYVGVSVNQFLLEVAEKKWAPPKQRGRRKLYDRKLLDMASDEESGIASAEVVVSATPRGLKKDWGAATGHG